MLPRILRIAAVAGFYFKLGMVHSRINFGEVIDAAIILMKDSCPPMISNLELRIGNPRLLVAVASRAGATHKSHMFVIHDRDADIELIDSVYDKLCIGATQRAELDPLPDQDVEYVHLLSGG